MTNVIEIGRAAVASRRISIYRAQPFWLDRGDLGAGRVREFRTEREARIAAGALAAARYYYVEVTVVRGYPGSDCWDLPQIVATYGEGADQTRSWNAQA